MKSLFLSLLFIASTAFAHAALLPNPPATPKHAVTDEYFGTKIVDDYRWLEDAASPEVVQWTKDQNAYARTYLDGVADRKKIAAQLKTWMEFKAPSYMAVVHRGGLYFVQKSDPPKSQSLIVSYTSPDNLKSEKVVVDPNLIDPTGKTAIDFFVPSVDGKLVAVALSHAGSEISTLHIYRTNDGSELADKIPNVNKPTAGGSVAWNEKSDGVFYTRYPQEGERAKEDLNFYQQIYFHKLGTENKSDEYSLGKDFPRIAEIHLGTSWDGKYTAAVVANGDGGEFSVYLLGRDGKWKTIAKDSDEVKSLAMGLGDDLYLISRLNAPKGKVLKTSLANPDLKSAQVVVPESEEAVVEQVVPTKDRLFVADMVGGPSQIRVFDLAGKSLGTLQTEPMSALYGLTRIDENHVMFGRTSYVQDSRWFSYTTASAETFKPKATALFHKSPVNFGDVVVKREFAVSKDGTKVPVNIIYKKGLKQNAANPTLLYAYGGYGISMTPAYITSIRLWLDHGGVYAVANIRGGGEYGDSWHLNGNLTKKQNVFDDFIAAAEHLISEKYTSPQHLVINGRSNGGLLMGAVFTQRPDLFRAVVSGVGIYDMLRVELDPNGAFNITEFGTVKNNDQFKSLYGYSPFHHVHDNTAYPAVLLTTGVNDGRVNPFQSKKMTARLQEATSSKLPVLLAVNYEGGHGMGSGLQARIAEYADMYAFFFKQLGIKY